MKLIQSIHQCSIVAMAMLLEVEPQHIIYHVGHDGTEIQFPEAPRPFCFRGVHIQELIDVAIIKGFGLVPFEAMPMATTDGTNRYDVYSDSRAEVRFESIMHKWNGLLCGQRSSGVGHTVAWDHKEKLVYDPCGPCTWSLDLTPAVDFKISTFWAAIETPEFVLSAISNHLRKII